MVELVLLACGLAVDATAAAAGIGAVERRARPILTAAALFGLFQGGMSALGWVGGLGVATWAAAWDHWVACTLLVAIGARTAWAAWTDDGAGAPAARGFGALLGLAVATSIDALAAGFTLPVLDVGFWSAIGTIGIVTAVLSAFGGWLGRALGDRFGSRLEIAGGFVLIGLGLKILVEHLVGGT
ncbi:MAG: manganese efflux pump MntP family protein [Myxococcota bacterium]